MWLGGFRWLCNSKLVMRFISSVFVGPFDAFLAEIAYYMIKLAHDTIGMDTSHVRSLEWVCLDRRVNTSITRCVAIRSDKIAEDSLF